MIRRSSLTWVLKLLLIDLTVLAMCGGFFVWLRGGWMVLGHFTFFTISLVASICVVGLALIGGYDRNRDMRTLEYASEHILTMLAVLFFSFTATYAITSYENYVKPSRSALLLGLLAFAPLSLIYRRLLSFREREAAGDRFFAVMGSGEMAQDVWMAALQGGLPYPMRFFDEGPEGRVVQIAGENSPVVEHDFQKILMQQVERCEGVVIAQPYREVNGSLTEFLLTLHYRSVPVYPLESFFEAYLKKIPLARIHLAWALKDGFDATGHQIFDKSKRWADLWASAVALMMLSPLLIFLALLVRLDSRGGAIFRQARIGQYGRPFTLYKFRTMREAADQEGDYTQQNDDRVTGCGRWMRVLRLDELPQLWNVFKGEMSLIGPRAEWEKLVTTYEKEIPFYHLRHLVKPGITGWAQVNYPYGSGLEDAKQKLQYDLYYLKYYSLKLDAAIVLKTLYVMFAAKGR